MESAQGPLLLISSDFPPVSGGQSRYLYDLWSQLPATEVVILAPQLEGCEKVDALLQCQVERRRLPLGSGRGAKMTKAALLLWAAFRLCLRHRPRAVHCGQVLSAGIAGYGCRLLCGVPYSVYVYGADLLEFYRRPVWAGIMRRILCRAERVYAISRYTAEIARRCGVEESRLELMPPALDLDRFVGGCDGRAWRRRRGWEEGVLIVSLGRLVERKGQDSVIRALADLPVGLPPVRYVIGGEGPYRAELEKMAGKLGVSQQVHFVGFVPEGEIPALLAAADVFAMLSRQIDRVGEVEGFGIVFLEANAAATPVLAGRSGGVEDAVEDGVNGLLVDPEDDEAVVEALTRLLTDTSLRQKLGQEGRRRVLQEFDRRDRAARLWESCS
jgi:phosphatidyl-myo-inositol dimannoside synthase